MSIASFVGTYYHNLDARNRLSIPARYRDVLGDRFYAMPGPSNNIWLYPETAFEHVAEQYRAKHRDPAEQEAFFSNVHEVYIDVKGRATIDNDLVAYAQLQKDVVFTGGGNRAVVWAIENYKPITIEDSKPAIDYSSDIDW